MLNNYYVLGFNFKEIGELGKLFWKVLNFMIIEFKKFVKLIFGWINRKCMI